MPTARQVASSAASLTELNSTSRVPAIASEPLIRRARATPSSAGIWKSRIARSKGSPASSERRSRVSAPLAVGDRYRVRPPAARLVLEDLPVRRVVVDDQEAASVEGSGP